MVFDIHLDLKLLRKYIDKYTVDALIKYRLYNLISSADMGSAFKKMAKFN